MEKTTSKIKNIRKLVSDNFVYINSLEDYPSSFSGLMIEKINHNPTTVFHFIEFIFQCTYIDLYALRGIIFIDDKISWEFLLKTEHGYLRIYDWKGYSVSIGSACGYGEELSKELLDKATLLKNIIEENLSSFIEFRKIEAKKKLEERPLDNFMSAFVSLNILLDISLEENKRGKGFLESLILLVSLIDTMLRYSILLTRINQRMSKFIDADLPELYCQKDKNYISERKIFELAKVEVDFLQNDKDDFFEKVNSLYDQRNKAVHRYSITNFQYSEVREVVNKYLFLKDILFEIITYLEKEQSLLGVGFVTKDDLGISEEQLAEEVNKIIETKINPAVVTKEAPTREAMFSEKYKGGVNPKLKKVFKKYEKEMKENYKWEKTSENTFELKQKKLQ